MEIIVPDDQLSLAIGRRGQNVRLAAQLTGWKLDINSETRVQEMREFANRSLGALPGINEMLHGDALRPRLPQGAGRGRRLARGAGADPRHRPGHDPGACRSRPESRRSSTPSELAGWSTSARRPALAEARRHPDELTQDERLARVRGVGEKTIEQLKARRLRHGRGHRQREGRRPSSATSPGWASRRPGRSRAPSRSTSRRRPSCAPSSTPSARRRAPPASGAPAAAEARRGSGTVSQGMPGANAASGAGPKRPSVSCRRLRACRAKASCGGTGRRRLDGGRTSAERAA